MSFSASGTFQNAPLKSSTSTYASDFSSSFTSGYEKPPCIKNFGSSFTRQMSVLQSCAAAEDHSVKVNSTKGIFGNSFRTSFGVFNSSMKSSLPITSNSSNEPMLYYGKMKSIFVKIVFLNSLKSLSNVLKY